MLASILRTVLLLLFNFEQNLGDSVTRFGLMLSIIMIYAGKDIKAFSAVVLYFHFLGAIS